MPRPPLPTSEPVNGEKRLRHHDGCEPGVFRRVNRRTRLERTVLTWLGFYPWECVSCRKRRYFRDQGRG